MVSVGPNICDIFNISENDPVRACVMLNWKIPNDGATGRLYGDTVDGATIVGRDPAFIQPVDPRVLY